MHKRWLLLLLPLVLLGTSFSVVTTPRIIMGQWQLISDGTLWALTQNDEQVFYCLDGNCVIDSIEGHVALPVITPATIAATQNNYAPTGCADANIYRLSSDASRSITGIDATTCVTLTSSVEKLLILQNVGAFPIILEEQHNGSEAFNRFALGADFTVDAGSAVTLTYDGNLRWIPAHPLPGPGGAGETNTHSSDGGGLALTATVPKVGVDLRTVSLATADFDSAVDLVTIDDTKWAKDSELPADQVGTVNDTEICQGDGSGNVQCNVASLANLNTALGSSIADGAHTVDQVGTVTSTDLCQGDGAAVQCTVASLANLNTALGSSIADGAHTTDQVGTVTNTDVCQGDGSSVQCTIASLANLNTALGSNIADGAHTPDEVGSVTLSNLCQGDGSLVQCNLAAAADSQVAGSDESDEIDDDAMPFDDADSNFTASTIGPAIEELDDVIGGGVPNQATGKVDWSELVNVPAGFADNDDAGGGGGGITYADMVAANLAGF